MSIVTAQDGRRTAPRQPSLTTIQDPVEEARRLRAAIDHHRTALDELLDQRRRHVAQLHAAGWKPGAIGWLYKLTQERARQIVTSARAKSGVA